MAGLLGITDCPVLVTESLNQTISEITNASPEFMLF